MKTKTNLKLNELNLFNFLPWLFCFCLLQVIVSSYEAAIFIVIEFDMDNRIFGLPRELVVASAGKMQMRKYN